MICKNCGYQIADGSAFCVNCGATVEAQPQQPQYQQPAVQEPVAVQPVVNEYEYYTQPSYEDPTMVETANACIKKSKTALKLSIVSLVVPLAFCVVALLFCWCAIIPFLNVLYGFFVGFVGTLAPLAAIACLILAFVTRASIKKLPEVSQDSVNPTLFEQYQAALKKAHTSKILNFVVLGILGAAVAIFLIIVVIALVLGGFSVLAGLFDSAYYY